MIYALAKTKDGDITGWYNANRKKTFPDLGDVTLFSSKQLANQEGEDAKGDFVAIGFEDFEQFCFFERWCKKVKGKSGEKTNSAWRYSINEGECGGIVYAESMKDATKKVQKKYNGGEWKGCEISVWEMNEDDYYDSENPCVWECYGL